MMKTLPLLFKTMEEALNYGLTYHATPYVVEVKGGFKAAIKKDAAPARKNRDRASKLPDRLREAKLSGPTTN